MSRLTTLVPFLVIVSFAAPAQGTFFYDQQSTTNEVSGEVQFGINASNPAQSFTPTLSAVGFVTMDIADASPQNSLSGTLYLNLRQDSATGTILATSSPVALPAQSGGFINFLFATPVSVTPGTTYYFDPTIQSGALTWTTTGSRLYNYAGGTAYSLGTPATGVDLWFREGVVVPEPSAFALLAAGAATVACLRHRKSRWA